MAAYVQTYAPGETIVTFKGHLLSGFGDEIVNCKRNNPLFTLVIGADGEGTYVKSADKSGEVTITVKQTSGANAVLGAIVQLDEVVGLMIGPLMIVDNNGHTLWSGSGRLAGYPDTVDRGKDVKDQVWKVLCPVLDYEFSSLPTVA
jgi:hypothetical protein